MSGDQQPDPVEIQSPAPLTALTLGGDAEVIPGEPCDENEEAR